jgi:hypothetical protein
MTYTPNDEVLVRKALYDLVAVDLKPEAGEITSETLGSYSYQRGAGFAQAPAPYQKAIIVASLLPKPNQLQTLYAASRPIQPDDPVINAPEYEPYPI